MERLETRLQGPALLKPVVHGDERGFFHESYRRSVFADLGIPDEFVQDNHSRSRHGIVRGMHFQVGAACRSSCAARAARSSTCWWTCAAARPPIGQWEAFVLNDENLHQLYCPIGFAHGFCVTSDVADVMYKCDGYYDESIERGIKFDDPDVGIEWPDVELIPSQRDAEAPRLKDIEDELPFRYEA